jgi:hypothetical protein
VELVLIADIKTRVGGLVLIAIGCAVGWFFLIQPLHEAQAGVAEVRYQLKTFLVVPACVVFGLAFVAMGARLNYRNVEEKTLTPTGWILFAIVTLLTAAGYWWFHQQFSALGYTNAL